MLCCRIGMQCWKYHFLIFPICEIGSKAIRLYLSMVFTFLKISFYLSKYVENIKLKSYLKSYVECFDLFNVTMDRWH
jgi:hypothetical protein